MCQNGFSLQGDMVKQKVFQIRDLKCSKDSLFAQWREKSVKIHWMQSETATSLSGKSLNVYLSIPQQIFQE